MSQSLGDSVHHQDVTVRAHAPGGSGYLDAAGAATSLLFVGEPIPAASAVVKLSLFWGAYASAPVTPFDNTGSAPHAQWTVQPQFCPLGGSWANVGAEVPIDAATLASDPIVLPLDYTSGAQVYPAGGQFGLLLTSAATNYLAASSTPGSVDMTTLTYPLVIALEADSGLDSTSPPGPNPIVSAGTYASQGDLFAAIAANGFTASLGAGNGLVLTCDGFGAPTSSGPNFSIMANSTPGSAVVVFGLPTGVLYSVASEGQPLCNTIVAVPPAGQPFVSMRVDYLA